MEWNSTYTTSGVYTFVTTNANGCDSTATLNLTINPSTTSTSNITECDTYTWNGTAYTTSGVYTNVTTNANGCDSTATLNLTINPSTTSTSNITECDTYSWNGTAYTTSGVYTNVTTNANGCDSTATLNLTINPSTTSTSTLQSVILILGMEQLILQVEFILLQQLMLMDVIVLLHLILTINPSTTSTSNITECDTYTWNGTAYTTSGVYTFATYTMLMVVIL